MAFIQNQRALYHVLFWLVAFTATVLIYGASIPGYGLTMLVVAACMPAQVIYFYTVAYIGMPRLLFRKKYIAFILFLTAVMLVCSFIFRLAEILIADPMIERAIQRVKPGYSWSKLEGTFLEQLKKPGYIIMAIEQTNILVWIAFAVKLFKMWYERRQAALQAELDFLKGQVHPHFLFNTLNNLYALTLHNSPRSPAIVLGLSEILRYMLYECNAEKVALKRDVEILQSYIALEKLRYEERLDLTFSINGDIHHQQIAPLLILPLLENAFKHGASEDTGAPWINISMQVSEETLRFKIANSKPEQTHPEAAKHFGKIGLSNVRKRLSLLYPSAHQLRIVDDEDTFLAILEVQLNGHTNI